MSLLEGFSLAQWQVTAAVDGREILPLLSQAKIDLAILDWMLPSHDGIALLKDIRSLRPQMPVLMLTAKHSLTDRVHALDSGADDYLQKPFAFAELMARCRALLRRSFPSAPAPLWSCGDLELDPVSRQARRAGELVSLTPREVDILAYLMRNVGQIVTRDMLETEVWKQSHRFTSLDNVIDVQMMRLRKKIERPTGPPLLHTVRGVGYVLSEKQP